MAVVKQVPLWIVVCEKCPPKSPTYLTAYTSERAALRAKRNHEQKNHGSGLAALFG